MYMTKSLKQIMIILFLFLIFLFGLVADSTSEMTNPTVEDELSRIPMTETSWEEWTFIARIEINGQPYLFAETFPIHTFDPVPQITQEGNSVILSQGEVEGILNPPFVHTLSYPTQTLPTVLAFSSLMPARPVETYLTFSSTNQPPFWYADGGTAFPSLTLETDISGYMMVCNVTGYYYGQPVTGVGTYNHYWIQNIEWEGFKYENLMWFKSDTFSGHLFETIDNAGTHHWSVGGIYFNGSGWETVTSFSVVDLNDQWNYHVTIEVPSGIIEFTTSDPISGAPYAYGEVVVFKINGILNGQPISGYGGNEVRRDGTPPNQGPPSPSLKAKSDMDYVATTVEWLSVVDPDGDDVTYNVRVGTSSGDNDVLYEEGLTGLESSFFDTIDGVTYYWSVQSSDGYFISSWATESQFTDIGYDPPNLSPPSPNLRAKSDMDYASTTVEWLSVVDPDGDDVTYNVRVGTSSGDNDMLYEEGLTGLESSTFDTVDGTTYYWSAQSSDGDSTSSWATESQFADVRYEPPNQSPPPPSLEAKSNMDYSSTTVEWLSVIDPDGDDVTYNVRVGTSSGDNDVLYEEGLTGLESSFFDTIDGVTYYWSVQSSDGFSASSWATEEQFTDIVSTTTVELWGENDTEDTMIANNWYASLNFGAAGDYMYVGSSGNKVRALIKWDLSSIPAGSTIVSAEMSLYCRENSAGGAITINAHRVLQSWVEGNQLQHNRQLDNPESSCWLEYGYGESWDEPGAEGSLDRDLNVFSTTTGSGTGRYSWNIIEAVINWTNGDWDNDGLLLLSGNETINNIKLFYQSEKNDYNYSPRLVIEYKAP